MAPAPPRGIEDDLLCFPAYANRQKYSNAWGAYGIEVKESTSPCSPASNYFSKDNVSYDSVTEELRLEYKLIDGAWRGSEVRMLNGQTTSFDYGVYTCHIKSVSVYEGSTLVSSKLPPDMVFAFFTYDTTDSDHYHREVDFELSQWNKVAGEDGQFVVQPGNRSGGPFKFYTGTTPGTYDQEGKSYSIDWSPGKLVWSTDAGGSHTHTFTSAFADSKCVEDLVQCLPSSLEVRFNLWNVGGGDLMPDFAQPSNVFTSHRIEVVIDSFNYTPSGLEYLADGEICSKHCQCGPSSICDNSTCTSSV